MFTVLEFEVTSDGSAWSLYARKWCLWLFSEYHPIFQRAEICDSVITSDILLIIMSLELMYGLIKADTDDTIIRADIQVYNSVIRASMDYSVIS